MRKYFILVMAMVHGPNAAKSIFADLMNVKYSQISLSGPPTQSISAVTVRKLI